MATHSRPWESNAKAATFDNPLAYTVAFRPAGPVKPARIPEQRKPEPSARKVFFQVSEGHSRTLVPGISLGLEWTDTANQRMNGWMWVMPDRRTIWLSSQHLREPLVFYAQYNPFIIIAWVIGVPLLTVISIVILVRQLNRPLRQLRRFIRIGCYQGVSQVVQRK